MPLGLMEKAKPGTGKNILVILIAEFVLFLNLGKNMNDTQVKMTAQMLIDDDQMKSLKPEDYKLIFEKAKMGHYGKFFDRMDGQVIFEICQQYMAERISFCEHLNDNTHAQNKTKPFICHPEVVEGYKKLAEEIKKIDDTRKQSSTIVRLIDNKYYVEKVEPAAEQEFKPRPRIEPSEEQKLANQWMKQFDQMPDEGDAMGGKKGPKFVRMEYGQIVNLTEFLEIKYAEHLALKSHQAEKGAQDGTV